MAGATLGLADSFTAAFDNPAGLALTMNQGDTHASTNRIYDGDLQDPDSPIQASSLGAALSLKNWGISLGLMNIWNEGQRYQIPGVGSPQWVESYVHEIRASAAYRVHPQLSLGGSLRIANAIQTLGNADSPTSAPFTETQALGVSLGALYRLPFRRVLLGASWHSPISLSAPGTVPVTFNALPGYAQSVLIPSRWGIGLGYVPNRLFRADFSIFRIGPTPGAALLSDQSRSVGNSATFEPHLGVAYRFADFPGIRGQVFAGTYLQSARASGTSARLHATLGTEIKWSFMGFGLGVDLSSRYDNYLAGISFDPIEALKRFEIVPRASAPPARGLFPRVDYESDEDLAPGLQIHEAKTNGSGPDILQVGKEIPLKLEEKLRHLRPEDFLEELEQLPRSIQNDLENARETIREQKRRERSR
jgi:hypothetical protein